MSKLDSVKLGRRAVLASVPVAGSLALTRSTRAEQGGPVRFAFFGDDAERDAYQLVIDAFHEKFPSIQVEPIAVASRNVPPKGRPMPSGGYPQWLRQSFTGDAPPDVFMLGYRDMGRYASRGLLEPLGGYLASSSVLQQDDFYPSALNSFRSPYLGEDSLGAIPQNASSLVVFYNTEMFDAKGITRPTDGWTWDQFSAAASALTLDLDGDGRIDVHGLAVEPSITRYAAAIWGAGGELFDDLHTPTKLTIDTPEALAGIRWLTSLGAAGLNVTPTEADARLLDDTRRFRSGHAAMLIQSRRVVSFLRQNRVTTWDVAPLPVGNVPANVLHSDGLALYAGSVNKEAAWTFMEFAMGPTGQKMLAESGRIVPSLRTVAESDAFLKGTALADQIGFGLRPANSKVFLDNIAVSRPLPSEISWPSVVREFDSAFKHAFFVDGNVDTAVTTAIAKSDPVFQNFKSMYRRIYQMSLPGPETED